METIFNVWQSVWAWVVGIIGGIGFGTIMTILLKSVLTGIAKKSAEKIALKDLYDKTLEESKKGLKQITFKQSIEPLVISEIEKVNEKVDARLTNELADLKRKNDLMLKALQKFASFFDDSYMVNAEKKEELKQVFEEYNKLEIPQEQEIIIESHEEEKHEQNTIEKENKPEKAKNKAIR